MSKIWKSHPVSAGVLSVIALLMGATAAFSQDGDEGPVTSGPKAGLCTGAGCPDRGDLECISGEVDLGMPGFGGSVTVTCYQPEN
ncbi:hypothetical protein [Candidatus Palauibacter sp.]|uniref:hypothetical protein n=1 Tax=Candidatus Palauibacter sp. TaxID=3101350 RepID=UPI003B019879